MAIFMYNSRLHEGLCMATIQLGSRRAKTLHVSLHAQDQLPAKLYSASRFTDQMPHWRNMPLNGALSSGVPQHVDSTSAAYSHGMTCLQEQAASQRRLHKSKQTRQLSPPHQPGKKDLPNSPTVQTHLKHQSTQHATTRAPPLELKAHKPLTNTTPHAKFSDPKRSAPLIRASARSEPDILPKCTSVNFQTRLFHVALPEKVAF
ncbi:hypothetical protein SNOG_14189 [Parastagonospora nodorum SN15]|uniref:Uncharacterized protein n=1 Tax=Phaeosphaeria nodorum (strain SN15 / ATCC MYA-4574 / FGSC 10173) TaxID=321614 RepID=Q0U217_PHANO|nr:hypothetical protein SNOG_14189 [Parastagonospora nodorum SN15]EAT78426.1 hypothetical protein SNOG_14189 [Parastagonospora nodorum SN15]